MRRSGQQTQGACAHAREVVVEERVLELAEGGHGSLGRLRRGLIYSSLSEESVGSRAPAQFD